MKIAGFRRRIALLPTLVACVLIVAGCASEKPRVAAPAVNPVQARALIGRLLPPATDDAAGWAADIYAAFAVLGISADRPNVCAVVAVTEQESGFHVNPVVPGLPAIAWREIDKRAEHAGVPWLIVHGALQLSSSTGASYSARIDKVRTEKELSDIFNDFIGSVPMGKSLLAGWNPVRTRGPMQVNIAFAERYAKTRPYPYPVASSIADELLSRRGSLYFGTAHLLDYVAPYPSFLYRFADFNAGQYASRNAAFQKAVASASGIPLVADGALLPHDADANSAGSTELAVRTLGPRLEIDNAAIHTALERGRREDFAETRLYQRVFALAEQSEGRPLPRAVVPRIELQGPKISRPLTTAWYANLVNERFKRCLAR